MTRIKGLKPLTQEEKQEIAQRYSDGDTLMVLCADYRRTKTTVKKVLADAGVTVRPTGYSAGREWTPAHREAHRRATSTPEFREKSRQTLLRRLPSMRGPATNTAIEQRLHDALRSVGIGFTTQSLLLDRYLVDIELHQEPIVIEADGSQHYLREQKAKDAARDAELTAAGYRIFRFTGSAINKDAAECIRHVINACGLTPDQEPVYNIQTRFAGALHPNWKGGMQEYTCLQCGTVYLRQPTHRRSERKFCSSKCYGESMRGKPQDPEHLQKRMEGMARARAAKDDSQIKIEPDLT